MGKAVSSPCCLALRQTMVGVVTVMETSFKRTCAGTVVFSALALQQATDDPQLCWRYLDTHMLWGI